MTDLPMEDIRSLVFEQYEQYQYTKNLNFFIKMFAFSACQNID